MSEEGVGVEVGRLHLYEIERLRTLRVEVLGMKQQKFEGWERRGTNLIPELYYDSCKLRLAVRVV